MDNEEKGVLEDRCSECGSSSSKGVPEITTEMMDILGQIKQFVSTLDNSPEQVTPLHKKLRLALQLMGKAKHQLMSADSSAASETPDLDAEVTDNMGLLQSHIDETLRLRQVKDEVTHVMDMMSFHLEKIGLKISVTSAADDENAGDSDADNSAIDREEDETGTSLAEEEEDDESVCVCEETVSQTSSVGEDVVEVYIEEVTDNAEDEGIEKGDLELTKESLDEEWTDDTDAGTTDDDASSLASEASGMSDVARSLQGLPPNILLQRHLDKSDLKATYTRDQNLNDNGFVKTGYAYTCNVLDLKADGRARNRRAAKLAAAQEMLNLLIRLQEQGTLPGDLKPFPDEVLAFLRPLAECNYGNAVSRLKTECRKLGLPPPFYKVLSTSVLPSGEKEVTVRCKALNQTNTAVGGNKRKARRLAAKNILLEFDKSNAILKPYLIVN